MSSAFTVTLTQAQGSMLTAAANVMLSEYEGVDLSMHPWTPRDFRVLIAASEKVRLAAEDRADT